MTDTVSYDPDRYDTLSCFHKSKAYITGLRGPAGSGKTYAAVWKMFLDSMNQEPNAAGERNVRWLVCRNTYPLLLSATIPTVRNALDALTKSPYGRITMSPPPGGKINIPLPDGTTLNIEMFFRSFDSEDSASNALGVEFTYVLIDEISEFGEQLVLDILRRCGRYPSGAAGTPTHFGLLYALNGPSETHWLNSWEMGERDQLFAELNEKIPHDKFFEPFTQPPGLIAPPDWAERPIVAGEWSPNPAAENIENLQGGYGYYYAQLTSTPDKIRAYVLGEYSPLVHGTRVIPAFNRKAHVFKADEVTYPARTKFYLSFDFGRTPVCLIACRMSNGRVLVVDECMGEDMAINTLWVEEVAPTLGDLCTSFEVEEATADPAGSAKTQAVETSPYEVLWGHGVPVEVPPCGNDIAPRLEACHIALSTLASDGKPLVMVSDACVMLIEALSKTYVYDTGRKSIQQSNPKPTKSHENWVSDLADAFQYLCSAFVVRGGKPKIPKQARPKSSHKARWL